MIKDIPESLRLSEKEMNREEILRGYPALRLMPCVPYDDFVFGIKKIGEDNGFQICYNEKDNSFRIMPFLTDMQGMVQFSYRVGCCMEKYVWSKRT